MTKLIKISKPTKSKNKKKQTKLINKALEKGSFGTVTGFTSLMKE